MTHVAAFIPDLFFASKVDATLRAAGYEVTVAPSPAQVPRDAEVLIVDLDAPDALAVCTPAPRLGVHSAVEVESVGSNADGFQQGQRVIAATRFNGFAELATTNAADVLPLPEGMSFEEGAALPVNYGTAYAAIVLMAAVRPGEKVLVHAA